LERPSTLKRHRDVPLLKEREEFLQRLHHKEQVAPLCVTSPAN
jgi:hypothetical protein